MQFYGNKLLWKYILLCVFYSQKKSYKFLVFHHRCRKGAFMEPQGKSLLINATVQGNATFVVLPLNYLGQSL